MSVGLMGLILVILLVVLLASGLWIALSLMAIGFIAMVLFTDFPVGSVMATNLWGQSTSWSLTALPLFIWMGEILFRTKISSDMFHGLSPWMGKIPGRLLHVNVVGCGIFAAISGSSTATAATIGRMALPELRKRGYHEPSVLGSLAASGSLGLLIPPSIILIVYGVAAEVSIGKLFVAGVLPGILIVCLFSLYIMAFSFVKKDAISLEHEVLKFTEKLKRSSRLIPAVLLIVTVIGSIYGGLTTPTEAAALGVVGALILGLVTRTITLERFGQSAMAALSTSVMINFILASAAFMSVAMAYLGIPEGLASWIGRMDLPSGVLLLALAILFTVMGCFLDGVSIIIMSTSVILPMIRAAGIDLIWFGIFLVIIVEVSTITPPVGFNLFVIQKLSGRDIFYISKGVLPFLVLLLLSVVIFAVFPDIITWLPSQMNFQR